MGSLTGGELFRMKPSRCGEKSKSQSKVGFLAVMTDVLRRRGTTSPPERRAKKSIGRPEVWHSGVWSSVVIGTSHGTWMRLVGLSANIGIFRMTRATTRATTCLAASMTFAMFPTDDQRNNTPWKDEDEGTNYSGPAWGGYCHVLTCPSPF